MSYNLQLKNNCYVITGGPGSGKSTLLNALAAKGYRIVPEVARPIIEDELASGGNALHTGDRLAFRNKMMAHSIRDFISQIQTNQPVFFDRGIPDLIGYSYLIGEPVPELYWQMTKALRYNPAVFIAPPWAAIYEHDELRKQDFQEAQDTYHAIKKGYLESGYQLIELPLLSVEERLAWVLQNIDD
ncbi:MAG: AAA family ATPase [Candidatus Berkiella sp.]